MTVLLWLHDPKNPRVVEAMTRRCSICQAAAGKTCDNTINQDQELPGRVVHLERIETWRAEQ